VTSPARRPSGEPPYWTPGTQIAWRFGPPGFQPGDPHFAQPMTVVRDDADGLVAWLAAGSPVLTKVLADGRSLRADVALAFSGETAPAEGTWTGYDVLRVAPTGRPWSVWVFFAEGTGDFTGWYVNIEDPHVRDDAAIYSRDHVLDVWVEPDRSPERKDEDELALAVESGRYDAATAAWIESVAEEIEKVIADWGPPFCDGWETFRPDPAWPIPDRPTP
jgi:hypothetical protein